MSKEREAVGIQRLLCRAATELRHARQAERAVNLDRVRIGLPPDIRESERLKRARRSYAVICERFVEAA